MTWGMVGMILITLLKILGVLLLIILFLMALFLFAPLRYRVKFTIYEEKQICGRISWLGFVLGVPFWWKEHDIRWKLRIFGIPIRKSEGDRTKKSYQCFSEDKKRERNKKGNEPKGHKCSEDAQNKNRPVEKTVTGNIEDTVSKQQSVEYRKETSVPIQKKILRKRKTKRSGWIRRLWKRIREFIQRIQQMICFIRGRVHSFQSLMELLREEYTKRFICIAKDNMLHLWKQLRPRTMRGELRFGTGDPCSTGQALGLIAVLYSWIGSGVHVIPDFEQKCLEGRIEIKGRIRMITLIVIAVKIMFNKDFKQLQRKWEQWKGDF